MASDLTWREQGEEGECNLRTHLMNRCVWLTVKVTRKQRAQMEMDKVKGFSGGAGAGHGGREKRVQTSRWLSIPLCACVCVKWSCCSRQGGVNEGESEAVCNWGLLIVVKTGRGDWEQRKRRFKGLPQSPGWLRIVKVLVGFRGNLDKDRNTLKVNTGESATLLMDLFTCNSFI